MCSNDKKLTEWNQLRAKFQYTDFREKSETSREVSDKSVYSRDKSVTSRRFLSRGGGEFRWSLCNEI